jgi:(E)-4-hydroxy-3-methylbut-2-enyl-diphosphate synthase
MFPTEERSMQRRVTREVRIGDVAIGGGRPIAIQSMTTTDTDDVAASVRQVLALARAGAAIVRLTVPSVRAAESLRAIHREVRAAGVSVPLVADIHYTPNAALAAAEIVEKVRINPGNFADRPDRARDGETFEAGAARVAEVFGPLVRRLAERGAALRIGVNHGSLSERITVRYGDTPEGMVESALEYLAVCERMEYDRVVVSLKSSIPAVTVAANRLFAERTDRSGGRYPLHLGVTEAGSGEEGRVRSAAGIGALLSEGLGDTIRVSLTEDPVREIPAAREILDVASRERERRAAPIASRPAARRSVASLALGPRTVGGTAPLAVLASPEEAAPGIEPPDLLVIGADAGTPARDSSALRAWRALGTPAFEPAPAFALETERPDEAVAAPGPKPHAVLFSFPSIPSIDWSRADQALAASGVVPFVDLAAQRLEEVGSLVDALRKALPRAAARGCAIGISGGAPADTAPALDGVLAERGLAWPLILFAEASRGAIPNTVSLAPPLLDGLGSLLYITGAGGLRAAWDILQGTRRRITRVEYISCPSCGRTLFDLEVVTERIRAATSHLKDVKIAVMGCIVNGPGEMADADFGYVGSGPGRVDLYVGSEKVEKSVPESEAVETLVRLIRSRGRWTDPQV